MRVFASVMACGAILLALAGCNSSDKHYFKEGVGANLYSESAIPIADDIATRTELLRAYVAEVCEQAGLSPSQCEAGATDPNAWSLFVQAGMNDIDQRCDAYLTWLDYVRRAQAPTLKEISDAQSATTVILNAAGVHSTPIAIVAAAFGFATNTYMNFMSRLILEVDKSTVQAIVLGRQKKYREELFGTGAKPSRVVIGSRPAAIFALRSYLRLCMPMTIETEINTTIATFERGGTAALARTEPMITAKTVGVSVVTPATDDSYIVLRALLYPNGAKQPDPERIAYARKVLGPDRAKFLGYILTTNNPGYAPLRRRLIACINSNIAGHACADGELAKP